MPSSLYFETITVAELMKRGLASHCTESAAEVMVEPLTQPSVLVVDDERVIADTLVLILNSKGFRATAAYNGKNALARVQADRPDILITDVMMPGMNGVHLAMNVQRCLPECRIFLFSGNSASQDLVESAHESGLEFEFLSKPVHPDTLLRRLSALRLNDDAA